MLDGPRFAAYSYTHIHEKEEVLMRRISTLLAAGVLAIGVSSVGWSEELVIKGTQIKGTPGHNAEIISKSVKLTKSAKIVKIDGAPEGLCIESPAEAPLCGSVKELTGKTLKPGSYTAYPNIPTKKDRESVTVHLK